MKKKLEKNPQKLHLNCETIRNLEDDKLKSVAGGATANTYWESRCFC